MTRPPVVVVMPGASLMQITRHASGAVTIRCPGCGVVWRYQPAPSEVADVVLQHDDNCPVLAVIREAERRQAQAAAPLAERN